jgi:hypothetical protein
MESVSIYLRTPLHSYGGTSAHLPAGVLVVEGQLVDRDASSIRVDADRLLDDRGRTLLDETVTLVLPWAKIDHMLVIA